MSGVVKSLGNAVGTIAGGGLGFLAGGPVGAAIGASIGSGLDASGAAERAADVQANAANQAAALQYQMWQEQQKLQEPWRQAGITALNQLIPLSTAYKPFTAKQMYADPGYAFRLSEGLKAMERSAAARGGLQSGAALKAAQRYGQDYASGEYTNAFNRYQTERNAQLNPLQSLAGVGQSATNVLGQAAQTAGSNIGQAQAAAAQARASGYVGGQSAISGALGSAGNLYMQNQLLNRLMPSSANIAGAGYFGGLGPTSAAAGSTNSLYSLI